MKRLGASELFKEKAVKICLSSFENSTLQFEPRGYQHKTYNKCVFVTLCAVVNQNCVFVLDEGVYFPIGCK